MITRSLALSLTVSAICLLLVGGPVANALFESPLNMPASSAQAPTSLVISPLMATISWIILGAVIATGIVLTVSQRSQSS